MPRYRFIGEYRETFPTLAAELEPGDEITTKKPIDHPRLELIDIPATSKAGVGNSVSSPESTPKEE